MLKHFLNGIIAGILISIGGTVYLSCENKAVGAVLFAVALICICMLGYNLFTGKVCYIPEKHDKEAFSQLLSGLLGNFIGTVVCGYGIRYAISAVGNAAREACDTRLAVQTFPQTLIRAMFCGILIYLAVEIYKKHKSIAGIVFCIPAFILSGFEHSIADMFYFAASGIVSLKAFGFIWTVILGNTVGGMLLPLLSEIGGKANAK